MVHASNSREDTKKRPSCVSFRTSAALPLLTFCGTRPELLYWLMPTISAALSHTCQTNCTPSAGRLVGVHASGL